MTYLVVITQQGRWQRLTTLVLDSISSPITLRIYDLVLDEFGAWYGQEPCAGLTKAIAAAGRIAIEVGRKPRSDRAKRGGEQ